MLDVLKEGCKWRRLRHERRILLSFSLPVEKMLQSYERGLRYLHWLYSHKILVDAEGRRSLRGYLIRLLCSDILIHKSCRV